MYQDLAPFWFHNKNGIIYHLWKQDIEKLVLHKKIPREWGEIKTIEYVPLSESSRELLEKVKAPIRTHEKGKYHLQIKVDDWQDKEFLNLLIQYHLIDIPTGNTVWELDRNLKANVGTVSQNKSVSETPRPVESPSVSPTPQASHRSNRGSKKPLPSRTRH